MAGDLLIPLFDGEGSESWPLSYVATVVINQVGDVEDCSVTQELVRFLSWLQVNQRAIDRASAQGWAPLSVAFKKKVIDVLGTVECEGELALTTAYVIGEGIARPALVDMAGNYESNTFSQKYFVSDVHTAVRDIGQGTDYPSTRTTLIPHEFLHKCGWGITTGAVDFAAVTTGAILDEAELHGEMIIPVLGYAAFPCYNVRTHLPHTIHLLYTFV
jgi:hypothetical protein